MTSETCVCDSCLLPLLEAFIKCVECKDLNLCLKCFALGVELGDHKYNHPYKIKVKNQDGLALFKDCTGSQWSVSEEVHLLDAVEQFGYGNWENVANYVRTRSLADCHDHFDKYYLNGHISEVVKEKARNPRLELINHTGPFEDSIVLPPVVMSEQSRMLIGFLPLRDDYEREYKNDFERLINKLTVNLGVDCKVENVASLQNTLETDERQYELIRVYLGVLRERQELKQHMRDFGLVSFELTNLCVPEEGSLGYSAMTHRSTFNPTIHCRLSKDNRAIIQAKSASVFVKPAVPELFASQPLPAITHCGVDIRNSAKTRQQRERLKPFSGDTLAVLQRALRFLRRSKRHATAMEATLESDEGSAADQPPSRRDGKRMAIELIPRRVSFADGPRQAAGGEEVRSPCAITASHPPAMEGVTRRRPSRECADQRSRLSPPTRVSRFTCQDSGGITDLSRTIKLEGLTDDEKEALAGSFKQL